MPSVLPTFDRLRSLPLGDPENRLRIGEFQIAFVDGVLLIESGAITMLHIDLSSSDLRVSCVGQRVLIDMLKGSAATVSMAATSQELSMASAYFRGLRIAVVST